MKKNDSEKIRQMVRDRYALAAAGGPCGCQAGPANSCCGSSTNIADSMGQAMGYSSEDFSGVVEGANLGLGCGNPTAIGNLQKFEIVFDLGSGGGFDCFLAAKKKVGDKGCVIGVDMTPEMLAKARQKTEKMGAKNVEFRLGEIKEIKTVGPVPERNGLSA
jgi:arsenite methyltransferase